MNQFCLCLCVLAVGCGASQSARSSEAAPSRESAPQSTSREGVPQTPTRASVMAALEPVAESVARCGRGVPGQATVRMEFASSGVATGAVIEDTFSRLATEPAPGCDSTPDAQRYYRCTEPRPPEPGVDECVLRAARTTRLPPFTLPTYVVNFPFRY